MLVVLVTIKLAAQQPTGKALPGKITGKVIDSASKQNIDYATISVFTPGKTEPITGSTTDNKGAFKIDGLAPGTYTLVIDFIGYSKKTITGVTITNAPQAYNAGTIAIARNPTANVAEQLTRIPIQHWVEAGNIFLIRRISSHKHYWRSIFCPYMLHYAKRIMDFSVLLN